MSLSYGTHVTNCSDKALQAGLFDRVQGHEPKNAPGHGLTAAFWWQRVGPVPLGSGLPVTTGRLEIMGRIYSNALQDPPDMIDPNLTDAADYLITAYSADFTLGDTIRNIDLLGTFGTPLQAEAGYITIGGTIFRCADITLPLIINDLWQQAA